MDHSHDTAHVPRTHDFTPTTCACRLDALAAPASDDGRRKGRLACVLAFQKAANAIAKRDSGASHYRFQPNVITAAAARKLKIPKGIMLPHASAIN